jgi:hypothetical protein
MAWHGYGRVSIVIDMILLIVSLNMYAIPVVNGHGHLGHGSCNCNGHRGPDQ